MSPGGASTHDDGLQSEAAELADKLIYSLGLAVCIELVLFKFLPDISTAAVQKATSNLTDFTVFEDNYLMPGSVHHARFLGNRILYCLAKIIAHVTNSTDIRLHPLRIAAGVLTPIYALIGMIPILVRNHSYDWRAFFIPYALAVLMGLYVFYPGDMPALAFLSIGFFFVLQERLAPALGFMLIVGLFRETSFHFVWFVGAWATCTRSSTISARAFWLLVFATAFVLEYKVVRIFFPGPISASGGLILGAKDLFMGKGIWSLTTLCSLSLAALFPAYCWTKLKWLDAADWRKRFFALNCAIFPLWIVFYRMLSGNISEFRMLFPAILPCLYGISYAYGTREPSRARVETAQ